MFINITTSTEAMIYSSTSPRAASLSSFRSSKYLDAADMLAQLPRAISWLKLPRLATSVAELCRSPCGLTVCFTPA